MLDIKYARFVLISDEEVLWGHQLSGVVAQLLSFSLMILSKPWDVWPSFFTKPTGKLKQPRSTVAMLILKNLKFADKVTFRHPETAPLA